LDALVRQAVAGEAGVVLVEGPAGIGKTRLLIEARAQAAEAGFRILRARGGELEREFAFGLVRQLFEPVLVDKEARRRALTGAAVAAEPVFEVRSVGEGGGGDPSFALLHGLYWLTVNLSADGPLLVAVDDLPWCDRASLRFLAYLVRRLEGLPVLGAISVRSSEPGVESAALGEIASYPLTSRSTRIRSAPPPRGISSANGFTRIPMNASRPPATMRPAATRCSCTSS
jgi:hypothetical protein